MDRVDRRLVSVLRADARASYAELARLVQLSAPAVRERLERLERTGVLTGYHAVVTPAAVGLGVSALVGVFQREGTEQDQLAERLRAVREIEDCWTVAGDEAFILKVRVADVDALERLLAVLRRIPGVARTRTTVVLSSRWEGRISLPEDADLGGGPAGPAGPEVRQ